MIFFILLLKNDPYNQILMKKHLFLFYLFLFFMGSNNLKATTLLQKKTDSLRTVLEKTKDLTKQATLYKELYTLEYTNGSSKKGVDYALKVNEIAKKIKNDTLIGESATGIAEYYSMQNNYVESIKYYEEALTYFKKLKDIWRIAFTSFYLGNQYLALSVNDKALENYYTALEYYEKNKQVEGVIMAYAQRFAVF